MIPLPVKTYLDIMAIPPCYDPVERAYCDANWMGTALDLLNEVKARSIPITDALFIVLRSNWLPQYVLDQFIQWSVDQVSRLAADNDSASRDLFDRILSQAQLGRAWNVSRALRALGQVAPDLCQKNKVFAHGVETAQLDYLIHLLQE